MKFNILFIDANKYDIMKYQIQREADYGSKYCGYAER